MALTEIDLNFDSIETRHHLMGILEWPNFGTSRKNAQLSEENYKVKADFYCVEQL